MYVFLTIISILYTFCKRFWGVLAGRNGPIFISLSWSYKKSVCIIFCTITDLYLTTLFFNGFSVFCSMFHVMCMQKPFLHVSQVRAFKRVFHVHDVKPWVSPWAIVATTYTRHLFYTNVAHIPCILHLLTYNTYAYFGKMSLQYSPSFFQYCHLILFYLVQFYPYFIIFHLILL